MTLPWSDFREFSARAQRRLPAESQLQECGRSIPVIVISDSIKRIGAVAKKLEAAQPNEICFAENDHGRLGVMATGPSESYILLTTDKDRQGVIAWWNRFTTSSGGASALMIADTTPHWDSGRWVPANVLAVFEFSQRDLA